MSLVGTRPPTVDEYKQYESHHKRRLSMKPGITGLWQCSGRSNIENFEEVVKLDVQYIDNWSLWGDVKILFKTVWVVLAGRRRQISSLRQETPCGIGHRGFCIKSRDFWWECQETRPGH